MAPNCFHFTIAFLLLIYATQSNLEQYGRSTPLKPISDGITTLVLNPTDVTLSPSQWFIDAHNDHIHPSGHLLLSINGSYGFHRSLVSTIQIMVDSEAVSAMHLLFSFTISPHFQYSSSLFNVSTLCNVAPPNSTQQIIHYLWSQKTNDKFPLILSLTNNPIDDYVVFQYHDSTTNVSLHPQCEFSPSFATERGLNVYIAALDDGQQFAINAFEVRYFYNSLTVNRNNTETVQYVEMDNEHKHVIYSVVVAASCICILCILMLCLKRTWSYSKDSHLSMKCSMQMTGTLEYNSPPKRYRFQYDLAQCNEENMLEEVHSPDFVMEQSHNGQMLRIALDDNPSLSPSNSFKIHISAKHHRLSTMPILNTAVYEAESEPQHNTAV